MFRKRIPYIIAFVILVGVECLIGAFVHDKFVRPYVGDMLVVIVVYAFVRIIVPEKIRLLPIWVFLFAVFVEIMQGIHIVDLLGIKNGALRTAIGTSFDIRDIFCYAVGCAILIVYEFVFLKKRREN